MGSRGRREKPERDREDSYGKFGFLREVGDIRLAGYRAMLESGGGAVRADGSARSAVVRESMLAVVKMEQARRRAE